MYKWIVIWLWVNSIAIWFLVHLAKHDGFILGKYLAPTFYHQLYIPNCDVDSGYRYGR